MPYFSQKLVSMVFSSAGLISGFRLVAISNDRPKCGDTTNGKLHKKTHISTLTNHMRCKLTMSRPDQAPQEVQFEVRYTARGMSRDALKSTAAVAGLNDTVVVLKLSRCDGKNLKSANEYAALHRFSGNQYLPRVFDYIPMAVAGEGAWQAPCSVLVVEACQTTVDDQLHIIVQVPVTLVNCR